MAKRFSGVNRLARASCPAQCRSMAKQDKSREEKLAKALRENLRRRKAQARDLDRPATPSDDGSSPSRR